MLNEQVIFFHNIANLFTVKTIYSCFDHDGRGPVSGIKNDDNNWNIQGHASRIIEVTELELKLFASLYDATGTPPLQARLHALHSQELIGVLEKFAAQPKKLGDLEGEYFSTVMFDETYAQRDGTIRRETRFPDTAEELILSGPHFFVGNPLHQTPRTKCTEKAHYDHLDLIDLPDNYLPRTNYVQACSRDEYYRRTPKTPWNQTPVIDCYRLVYRAMLPPPNERTLFGAIYPPGIAHTNACRGYVFSPKTFLQGIIFGATTFSIPYDFYTKTTGRTNLHQMLDSYPLVGKSKLILVRVLALNCITLHFSKGLSKNSRSRMHWHG